MKNIKIKLTVLLFSAFLFSCSDVENEVYSGPEFVQLTAESGAVVEDAGTQVLTLSIGAGQNPNGVTVNFEVVSDDPTRFQFEPSSGSVTIPAGEFNADILFTPIDNFDTDGDVDVTLNLLQSSDVPVGIGGEDTFADSVTFTILDNDCPFESDAFPGVYLVDEVFTSGTNEGLRLGSAFGEVYSVQLTPQPGDLSGTKFVVTNSTGADVFINDGTIMTFLTCSGTVDIDDNQIALFSRLTIESSSYDEEDSEIVLAGPLGGFGPYQIILTRL